MNNIVRVALQGFAAVCGGTQSLHTNGFDEALGLPTEHSAKIALRTQQMIAHESGAADTVDPFAGSYYVERLTDDIENQARALMAEGRGARRLRARDRGGLHPARDRGVGVRLPHAASTKQDIIVGVNDYVEEDEEVDVEILKIDPQTEQRAGRPAEALQGRSRPRSGRGAAGRSCARSPRATGNLLYPIKDALRDRATLGEVCGVMREVFGEYKPPVAWRAPPEAHTPSPARIPRAAARAMLEYKGIEYKRIDLLPVVSRVMMRLARVPRQPRARR